MIGEPLDRMLTSAALAGLGALAGGLAASAGLPGGAATVAGLAAGTAAAAALAGAFLRRRGAPTDPEIAVFEAIALPAILYDAETLRIVRANRTAVEHLGYSAAEFRDKRLADLLPEAEAERFRNYLEANAHLERRHVEWKLPDKDGRMREFEVLSMPVRLGGRRLRLVVGVDLANHRRIIRRVKRAEEKALAARQAKEQFLAVVGHELRNPLTAVVTGIQALQREPLTRTQRHLVDAIARNADAETRLVDDMLDFIRGERRALRLEMRPVDVHELVRQVADACRGEIDRNGLRLSLDLAASPPHVEADPARLQQVLWNLFRNAIKFTPRGGEVRVCSYTVAPEEMNRSAGPDASTDVGVLLGLPMVPDPGAAEADSERRKPAREPDTPPRSRGGLVVEISDTGVGIDPFELDRIFDPFAQGQTTQRLWSQGLGLGLAISRSIASAHGGHLEALSAGPGRGSTFRLELVRAETPATAPGGERRPAAVAAAAGRPLDILLVDDNRDVRQGLARLLNGRDHRVTQAEGVREALAKLRASRFDLLISDLQLPDGTGHELLVEARRGQGVTIPAIALSGHDGVADRERSLAAGFAMHLGKPVYWEQLDQAIRKALNRAGG